MAFLPRLLMVQLNDQYVQLDGVADGLTGAAITGAVLAVTLRDFNGTAVLNMTALTMASIGAGSYRCAVTSAFNPPLGTEYTAVFDGTNAGLKLHIELPVTVGIRTS